MLENRNCVEFQMICLKAWSLKSEIAILRDTKHKFVSTYQFDLKYQNKEPKMKLVRLSIDGSCVTDHKNALHTIAFQNRDLDLYL